MSSIDLSQLHKEIMDGDVTAPARLIQSLAGPLTGMLSKLVGTSVLDADDVADAVTDSLMVYLGKPDSYVEQGSATLFTYLLRIAQYRALDTIRRRKRYKKNFPTTVEECQVAEIDIAGSDNADVQFDAGTIMKKFGSEIAKDAIEQEVLRLHLEGEKDTHVYANVIGIVSQPFDEQCATVKRYRDRIERRLIRLGERL